MSGYFDGSTTNGNFTWWNTTALTSDNIIFSACATTTTDPNWCVVKVPDKDWMPYAYVEYEPRWHQKFARYKLQIKKMWD